MVVVIPQHFFPWYLTLLLIFFLHSFLVLNNLLRFHSLRVLRIGVWVCSIRILETSCTGMWSNIWLYLLCSWGVISFGGIPGWVSMMMCKGPRLMVVFGCSLCKCAVLLPGSIKRCVIVNVGLYLVLLFFC